MPRRVICRCLLFSTAVALPHTTPFLSLTALLPPPLLLPFPCAQAWEGVKEATPGTAEHRATHPTSGTGVGAGAGGLTGGTTGTTGTTRTAASEEHVKSSTGGTGY